MTSTFGRGKMRSVSVRTQASWIRIIIVIHHSQKVRETSAEFINNSLTMWLLNCPTLMEWVYMGPILWIHRHAINTAPKNRLETVQWKKKRKWNFHKRPILKKKLWKCQVFVAHSFCRVICRNVSCTLVEISMETPYWRTVLDHQYGCRKSSFL